MTGEGFPPPTRLMNFVSQEQLDEAKKTRGPRVEDGTAHRDRPLFEILKENKDKKDAEFNERFKHRPPKALDEDETEFLDKLEMSRREYEQEVADDEAQQLRSFQEAVAAQSAILHELKEMPAVPKLQEQQLTVEKKTHAHPLGVVIKVRPQAKKAKIGQHANSGGSMGVLTTQDATATIGIRRSSGSDILNESDVLLRTQDAVAAAAAADDRERPSGSHIMNVSNVATGGGLVSYSDESDDD